MTASTSLQQPLKAVITPGWKQSTLEDAIATVRNGLNCKQDHSEAGDAISRIETIAGGSVNIGRVGRAMLTHEQKSKFLLVQGDILFSHINSAPHIGKCAIVEQYDEPVYHGVNLLLMRSAEGVLPQFLRHYLSFLHAQGYWLTRCKQSVNQASVNQQDVKKVPFPHPPFDEQKRIVAVLNQAFAALDHARALAEANLADAQELLDVELVGIFNRVDGDDIHSISSAFATATGATPPKSDDLLYGEDIRFVKPPELLNGLVDETRDGLSEAARPKARLAPAGAVLVSCIGNLGKIGLLDREAAFNQQINAILPNAKIARPYFISWQCRSRRFRDQLGARSSGTTIPIVNKKQFNSIPVWLPTLEEQDRISKHLDETERNVIALRHLYEAKLKDLDDFRQSLLQKAFSGQLP